MISEKIMLEAIKEAEKAFQNNKIPIGSVIVERSTQIIVARSHNEENTSNAISHAEILAITKACKDLNTYFLNEYDLYTTLEPCPMCLHAIINARIGNLFVATKNIRYQDYYEQNKLYIQDKINIVYGLFQKESSDLIKKFFILKR